MANWISSKLKVAESLLQQIDQQAADSLNKGDRKQSDDLDVNTSPKSGGTVPLRDQLKKKTQNGNENFGKSKSNSGSFGEIRSICDGTSRGNKKKLGNDVANKPSLDLNSTVKDSDWTELLNTPNQSTLTKAKLTNGAQKDGGKVGNMGLKVKGNGKVVGKTVRKADYGDDEKVKRVVGDSGGNSSRSDRKSVENSGLDLRLGLVKVEGNNDMGHERDKIDNGERSWDDDRSAFNTDSSILGNSKGVSALVSDEGNRAVCDDEGLGSSNLRIDYQNGDNASSSTRGLKSACHSVGDHESDSESTLSSDSEGEQEREEKRQRRRQILADKAAAKALQAIKDQENVVARLEGEKQSLQKMLEEQSNQAAQEASELQSMTMEMMEAAEVEKQKHNHTRMEILGRLAKLETANADLAKSLAAAQWNLEIEVNRLADLRHQVELKEAVLEELNRKTYNAHQARASTTSLMASKGFELEKEMLEDECAFATEKIARLQEKVTTLEANIDMAIKEMENSTEVEVELRRRLSQMTDHLIQKQSQAESLSSDKATLLFRIEAVSRLLDEHKLLANGGDISLSSREDLEAGTWESTRSILRPMFENKIQSGRQHLGSMVRQLDTIFSAGAVFLARNPAAKLWSFVYLVSLHLWVLYILFSHSQSTEDSTSSSVLSLENINGSVGV
ncbi:Golgin candidate 2 [Bienertia sinuspersici]